MKVKNTVSGGGPALAGNVLLRVGLYVVLLIYVTAVTGANDDECEETAPDGAFKLHCRTKCRGPKGGFIVPGNLVSTRFSLAEILVPR